MATVAKVSRTIGPWGAGLAGYDADGRLLVVLKVRTKNVAKWVRGRVDRRDRERVQAAAE